MSDTNRSTWEFLVNTYWYVPQGGLPALEFARDDNQLVWKGDQTVWHISGYQTGYFWGATAAIVFDQGDANSRHMGPKSQSCFVGSISPEGQVQMNFFVGSRRNESIITGLGKMVKVDGEWAFQMQMSTPSGSSQLFHWANMLQTKEGEASWDKLPGLNYSVPQMMEDASYPSFASE